MRIYTYRFSKNDNNNKHILLIWKGVDPYECMDDWEKFNETSLPEKEDFYIYGNVEDITDADYAHAIRVCKDFAKNNLRNSWFVCLKQYIIVRRCIWEL